MGRNTAIAGAVLSTALVSSFLIPDKYLTTMFGSEELSYARHDGSQTTNAPYVDQTPQTIHHKTPDAVKAIYMSQCAATSEAYRTRLFALADSTEVNSIIVDLKDYSGTVAFPSKVALPGGKGCTVSDFADLVAEMHKRNIYVIGRLTVFQDPLYTATHPELAVQSSRGGIWKDRKGLGFVDVGSEPFWEYIVALAHEAHALGVDEINFDYIRYPSDGPMAEARYTQSEGTKQEQLEKFFMHVHDKMKVSNGGHVPVISADLFGMTTTNLDDLTIGQVLERALPYFDYIAPMVYPSHYPPNFNGWANPNDHVYGVIHYSMSAAVSRAQATTTSIPSFAFERIGTSTPAVYRKPAYEATKLRTWIQDFDYGGDYDAKDVRDQIQATYDAGLTSWMIWAPSNIYTKEALLPE